MGCIILLVMFQGMSKLIFIVFISVLLVFSQIIARLVLMGFIWRMIGVLVKRKNRRCASRKKCTRMGFVMSTAAENARTVCRPRVTVASALSSTPEMKMESASSRVM
jgi:hypothetical protein